VKILSRGWPDVPQTVIFLEDLGLGEKGIAEMLAPVLIRRLTLCFTQGSSVFTVITEPGREAQGPIIGWEALASVPRKTRDSVHSNVFPDKWGRVLEVAFFGGTPC
jgi:hypothetical protein